MPTKPRIASLCPSNTEIVSALGLGDCLVGVDLYSDYPAAIVNPLPKLGPDLHIDIEMLASLKPDLTICSLSVPGMERVVESVRERGLPYIVLSPHRIEDIWTDMYTVADAVAGAVDMRFAADVIEQLQQRVYAIREHTAGVVQKPKLYWEWWPNPVFSPARTNWLTELSALAGGLNIFADSDGDQVQDDGTKVLEANPDVMLAVWTGVPQQKVPLQKIRSRPGWDRLTAYRTEQVYVLPEGLYCRPSPRVIDGLEQLLGLIHPNVAQAAGLGSPSRYGPVRRFDGSWLDEVTP